MSVSPFLSGNSIWSTSANAEPSSLLSSSVAEANARHPLPTKPAALGRSNSTRARPSETDAAHLGVIGAPRGSLTPDLNRTNSLASSYQSFRSASAELPHPSSAATVDSFAASPSFVSSFADHKGCIYDSNNPRLFVDSQHASEANAFGPWVPAYDRDLGTTTPDLGFQRPTSRQADRAASGSSVANKNPSAKRRSTQIIASNPDDSGEMLNAQNLQMHQQGGATRSTSPLTTQSRTATGLNVPSYMNLSGGLLSPTAATMGSNGPSPMQSPSESTPGRVPELLRSVSADSTAKKTVDETLAEAPMIKDMMERLTRVEGGMKDFSRQISGISRNVSLLLERTKSLAPASFSANNQNATNALPADDLRSLNAQVSSLANSVSQLLSLQNNSASPMGLNVSPGMMSHSPLTGLGIGGPHGSTLTPQMGSVQNGQFVNRPSPFLGTSPRPNERRWSAAPPASVRKESHGQIGLGIGSATPQLDETTFATAGSGYTQPNAVVTKWEHLNLNPDLLRSILKYGLGPPNKIQQRSLPFLLRGSDIIAQAPPTQERIASYVIPALQLVLNITRENRTPSSAPPVKGPLALIISTTVDQATQAQRMALGLGAPLGVRVHIVAGGMGDLSQEVHALEQARPHIIVGTPQKVSELLTHITNSAAVISSQVNPGEIQLVVLDEVDQLIARNLADHVSSMLRVLPPVQRITNTSATPVERQVALFSNTVPQDVLNFAQSIHLRESVRVLVRRDGNTSNGPSSASQSIAPGEDLSHSHSNGAYQREAGGSVMSSAVAIKNLRQYYLYVAVNSGHNSPVPGAYSSYNNPASEMKLDLIADLLEDIDFGQVVVYTANAATQEAVVYKLSTKGIEAMPLQREMHPHTKQQTLTNFRSSSSQFNGSTARARKALVVSDMVVNSKDVQQIPLVVFYDTPRSVEEYKDKVSCAITPNSTSRSSVCIIVVTASGGPRGDVEMLRTLECHLACKMAELPLDSKNILNY